MKTSQVASLLPIDEVKTTGMQYRDMAANTTDTEERKWYIEWAECYERELASRTKDQTSAKTSTVIQL